MKRGPIMQIVGARPNFMKAAPVVAALAELEEEQLIVHTGQHYDERMSDIFFRELELPRPDINLGVGSGTHGVQTAALLTALEDTFIQHTPRVVVVYGDVNSTLAATLAATKLGIPIAHVEAGLRSFDRSMPEEINRVATDALATMHFVTSPEAIGHLANEGIDAALPHFVGNPMIDTLMRLRNRFDAGPVRDRLGLEGPYVLSTLHRPANVDDPVVAESIVKQLNAAAANIDVVIPLHPRGRELLERVGLTNADGIMVIDPLGYIEFASLMSDATVVLTDSGGVQEESTILEVPCLTVRPNTERPITISHGTNRLIEPTSILSGIESILSGSWTAPSERPPLWDGKAGTRIAAVLAAF